MVLLDKPIDIAVEASSTTTPTVKRWTVGTLSYTRRSLGALFFWLLWGDFTLFLRDRAAPPTLQLLLLRYSASNALVGFLLGTLPNLITLFLSPIVSYRSDRHRGRWGRRIPYLFVPTPLAVLSMIGLAFSPPLGRWLHATLNIGTDNGWILTCFALFWVIFEVSSVICSSVLVGLCNDVVPKPVLGRFFGLFRMVSVGAAIVFNYWLLGQAETWFRHIFIGLAILYGISFSLMCLKVREGEYPPPPADERTGNFRAATANYLRQCFGQSFYVWFFASVALANMSFTCVVLFTVSYAKAVKMDMTTYGKYLTAQFIISFLQSYPLGWLSDKIHPLRLIVVSLILYALATLVAFFSITDATTFGVYSVIVGIFAGWWLTAFGPLGPAMLPKMRYAQFASAMTICSSLGSMIVGPACGKFLDLAGNDYRYIYLWAAVFAALSLGATLVVYRKFAGLGGPRGYAAPE